MSENPLPFLNLEGRTTTFRVFFLPPNRRQKRPPLLLNKMELQASEQQNNSDFFFLMLLSTLISNAITSNETPYAQESFDEGEKGDPLF